MASRATVRVEIKPKAKKVSVGDIGLVQILEKPPARCTGGRECMRRILRTALILVVKPQKNRQYDRGF